MKKISIVLASLLVLAGTIYACSTGIENKSSKAEEPISAQAQQLPSFQMKDANGKQVNLSSFKGKKVFVNVWATWCPPCRAEIPSIEQLYNRVNKDKAVFIMLSLDDNFETAKQFARAKNMKVPVYYAAETLPQLFNTPSIPVTYIFNEKGKLVKHNTGMDDYNTDAYFSYFK